MATLRIRRQYRTYRYQEKNPVIDKMRTIAQDEGMYSKKQRGMLAALSGVARATYDGWWDGDTKNPQHHTAMAFITSLGYEEQFVKAKPIDVEKELKAAANWALKEDERVGRMRKATKKKTNGKGGNK